MLFSAVSPRAYKRESRQRNDAILSKLCADSFTMADSQVPANAVQEAQVILQNPPPDEAQAPGDQAQAQAQASAQADQVSLEVFKTVFSLFFATCFVPVFMCLVCFGSTVLFHFVRSAFNVCPFHVGFAGHFVFSYAVCPALNVLPLLWALRAIFGLICCLPCF